MACAEWSQNNLDRRHFGTNAEVSYWCRSLWTLRHFGPKAGTVRTIGPWALTLVPKCPATATHDDIHATINRATFSRRWHKKSCNFVLNTLVSAVFWYSTWTHTGSVHIFRRCPHARLCSRSFTLHHVHHSSHLLLSRRFWREQSAKHRTSHSNYTYRWTRLLFTDSQLRIVASCQLAAGARLYALSHRFTVSSLTSRAYSLQL